MSWSFETEPEFQRELDWIDAFVTEEIEPLDFVIGHPNDFTDPNRAQADSAAAGRSEETRFVGVSPRTRTRRPGLRSGQARA